MKLEHVHAAARDAKKKAQPVFEKSEQAAAVSYAVFEFVHVHQLVVAASAVLLLSFGIILFGWGVEMVLVYMARAVAVAE